MNIDRLSAAAAAALLLACGAADPDAAPDAAPDTGEADWHMLVAGDWAIPAGSERYLCVRYTLEEDLYIGAFEAVAPPGTHHTVLTAGPPSGPDGVEPCDSFENNDIMIFGSGVGTDPFALPGGVAVRVEAGQQLLLNLHLFNASDAALTGTSGIRAALTEAVDTEHVAESLLMGPIDMTIPPGEQTVTGGCTMRDSATLLAVAPHMHKLGRHMKVTVRRAGGDVVVHDAPYDFDSQQVLPIEPGVTVERGDYVEVECRYDNQTGQTVTWGESSLDEMCFAGLYRYPVRSSSSLFVCAQ